jgi:uncharacterized protein (DUF488 family)
VALLQAHGVDVVADVRRFPGSRRNPQFGRDALRETLAAPGIDYVHLPALGGRRGAPRPDSPNGAWRVAAFRAYADAMGDPEWLEGLGTLEALAGARPLAYMCAEAVPWRCHRRLISDALVARGWIVKHILAEGRVEPHTLHEAARIDPEGRLTYPLPEAEQRTLF